MSREIVRLGDPGDFDELMRVLDTAFGREKGWFAQAYPHLYRPTTECIACHYAVRDGGRIVAALGVYPLRWRLGEHVLDVAGIGGVGTHPDFRGHGLMGELLRHVIGEVRRREFHLSWLGGQRQRYRHYGWERSGTHLRIDLSQANVRHEPTMRSLARVTLTPLSEAASTQIAQIQQWHDAQALRCERRTDQFTALIGHDHAQPRLACDEHGELIGYAVLGKDGQTVTELVGRDLTAAQAIARALAEQVEAGYVSVLRSALPCAMNRWLLTVAENATCTSMGNWQVFDWPLVIEALLTARHQAVPLMPGSVALGIEGESRSLQLTVDDGQARASWSDAAPAMTLDAAALTRLLLGPVKPSHQMALPGPASVLDAWCPLPATIPYMDKV